MVHYAGYAPRFHPSDFRTRSLDGVGADWPISYEDLPPPLRGRRDRARPWPARTGAGAIRIPTPSPRTPSQPVPASHAKARAAPASRFALVRSRSPTARSATVRTASIAGSACRAARSNAKASPLVTHLPDAIEHGSSSARTRMPSRSSCTDAGARAVPAYDAPAAIRLERAAVVAIAGYSIETLPAAAQLGQRSLPGRAREQRRPGRPLHHGPGSAAGRSARFSEPARHVQRAAAGDLLGAVLRDRRRARVRAMDLAIQTVGPEPIAWAEHVLAHGYWGQALRETCATTTMVHARHALRAAAAAREPRDLAQEKDARGSRSPHGLTRSVTTTAPTSPTRRALLHRIWEAAGAQARPDHRPLRRPRRRLPDGYLAARTAWSTPTTGCGASRTSSWPTGASCPRGIRQPRPHDHGPRVTARRPPRRPSPRRRCVMTSPRNPPGREVVAITGASAGVGRAIAHAFRSGWTPATSAGSHIRFESGCSPCCGPRVPRLRPVWPAPWG